jgi:ketosteroid isomerase-like protein
MAAASSIRAQRTASNQAIAARDAEHVVSFMMPDAIVEVAGGATLRGREASRAAFAEQFADAAMLGYVRTPEQISVHPSGQRATERGRWTGRWRIKQHVHEQRGNYSAEWQLTPMGWFIASERFVLGD